MAELGRNGSGRRGLHPMCSDIGPRDILDPISHVLGYRPRPPTVDFTTARDAAPKAFRGCRMRGHERDSRKSQGEAHPSKLK